MPHHGRAAQTIAKRRMGGIAVCDEPHGALVSVSERRQHLPLADARGELVGE